MRRHLLSALLALPALLATSLGAQQVDFEGLAVGEVSQVDASGTWSASAGHARIDEDHATLGARCLHLGGSGERAITWRPETHPDVGALVFRAERWTQREPFAFAVDIVRPDGATRTFDLSDDVVVGRGFLSTVRVPVPYDVATIRWRCTAPEGTGVLIDDVALLPDTPATLASVDVAHPVLPALVGNPWNPLLRVDLVVAGTRDDVALDAIVVELSGVHDLDLLAWFVAPRELSHDRPRDAFGIPAMRGEPQRATSDPIPFTDLGRLAPGEHSVWLAASLTDRPDLDGRVGARVVSLRVGGRDVPVDDAVVSQRLGVALRSAGDDASRAFRIPGLVTTRSGTLIATYDVRWRGWGDLPGDVDVAVRRSTDGGRTWSAQQIVLDMGNDPDWRHDGVGDPSILVDRATGRVFVFATWSHGDRAWRGSGPGLSPEETGQLVVTSSDDDGMTWSAPRNLTTMVKRPEWSYLLQGPGRGITMEDGTLALPAQFQAPPSDDRIPSATLLTSDDHGETWRIGTSARLDTTESAVVELARGALMLNMRDNRGGSRAVSVTRDLGATWSEHPTSRRALVEPVCMASLIHVGRALTGEADGRLLFSNPAVASAPRRRMTIRASSDFGGTWPRTLLLDEGTSAGYSCLTMIDEDTVGILYEGNRAHLTFQRVPLAELFDD